MADPCDTPADCRAYSQLLLAGAQERMKEIADKYNQDGDILSFNVDMREAIREIWALQSIAGNGGTTDGMSGADWLRTATDIRNEYETLANFNADIRSGDLSPAQIAARAQMYAGSSKLAYSKQATADLDLPVQPTEDCACGGNCNCEWVIEYNDDGSVDAYWTRHNSNSCPDCVQREEDYQPYHIEA